MDAPAPGILLADDWLFPRTWHTVGDSRPDHPRGDHLHGLGYEVTHVDVGRQPPLAGRRYPGITVPGLLYAAAGEGNLRSLTERFSA